LQRGFSHLLSGQALELRFRDPKFWLRAGDEARERDLARDQRLSTARIVMFATHGLIAREALNAAGLDQPAPVLTPPWDTKRPPASDDGLLTLREIAALRISADWVILDACNSADGDGTPNGDCLTGPGSLHVRGRPRGDRFPWELDSGSHLFSVWNGGRVPMDAALSYTMQAMRNGDIDPASTHQTEFYWAPFVIVAP
jgi:hypothetical protein